MNFTVFTPPPPTPPQKKKRTGGKSLVLSQVEATLLCAAEQADPVTVIAVHLSGDWRCKSALEISSRSLL